MWENIAKGFGVVLLVAFGAYGNYLNSNLARLDDKLDTLSLTVNNIADTKTRLDAVDVRINNIVVWKKALKEGIKENGEMIEEIEDEIHRYHSGH